MDTLSEDILEERGRGRSEGNSGLGGLFIFDRRREKWKLGFARREWNFLLSFSIILRKSFVHIIEMRRHGVVLFFGFYSTIFDKFYIKKIKDERQM